jgi:hypothetical protein
MGVSLGIRDTKAFRDAWDAGVSHKNIAVMLGCSEETVRRRASEFGYPKRDRINAPRPPQPEKPQRDDVRKVEVASGGSNYPVVQSVSLPREPWLSPAC